MVRGSLTAVWPDGQVTVQIAWVADKVTMPGDTGNIVAQIMLGREPLYELNMCESTVKVHVRNIHEKTAGHESHAGCLQTHRDGNLAGSIYLDRSLDSSSPIPTLDPLLRCCGCAAGSASSSAILSPPTVLGGHYDRATEDVVSGGVAA